MDMETISRQALLFAHVIFFALAVASIVKEDIRLLFSKRIDKQALESTAWLIKWMLLGLWATGIPMVAMDIGTDLAALLVKPKLFTKIGVVTVLTLNGALLSIGAIGRLSVGPGVGNVHLVSMNATAPGEHSHPALLVALMDVESRGSITLHEDGSVARELAMLSTERERRTLGVAVRRCEIGRAHV